MGLSQTTAIVSAGKGFCRDAAKILLHPGAFYETMPAEKDQRDAVVFLLMSALIYSLGIMIFAHERHAFFGAMSFLNGVLMPLVNAAIVCLVLQVFTSIRLGFAMVAGIAVYANAALVLAWIPGMAPFAEILKYVLMGVGLVKATQLSAMKVFLVILGTAMLLLMLMYGLQNLLLG